MQAYTVHGYFVFVWIFCNSHLFLFSFFLSSRTNIFRVPGKKGLFFFPPVWNTVRFTYFRHRRIHGVHDTNVCKTFNLKNLFVHKFDSEIQNIIDLKKFSETPRASCRLAQPYRAERRLHPRQTSLSNVIVDNVESAITELFLYLKNCLPMVFALCSHPITGTAKTPSWVFKVTNPSSL